MKHGLLSCGLSALALALAAPAAARSEEHTSELQSRLHLVCRLLLEKKKNSPQPNTLIRGWTTKTFIMLIFCLEPCQSDTNSYTSGTTISLAILPNYHASEQRRISYL